MKNTKEPHIIGKEVIEAESKALQVLAQNLDENFTFAVQTLSQMEEVGRVVVSGMGKCSFIGMKISATFASIGIPSFFLHPAEAVHGDLGRFTKHDVALLLSNSGETQEIVELLPFLRRVGCPIIAITADADSTLGRNALLVLSIGRHKEAGPLGLAPTTSTTTMLAMGDAIAMALLELKGLSESDFAGLHPAGSLGRSLLTVSEIMRSGDQLCLVPTNLPCRLVLESITNTRGRPGAAVVVHSDGTLAGIFTDGDLRRCLNSGKTFLADPVEMYMGKTPQAVFPTTLVREATTLMSEKRIDQVIVIDEQRKPLGLVDIQDAVSVRMR